ncbi:hypothetical protein BS50DRAFT_19184 [Corynespora cassiicola Philippines]|uniref:Uncharacterized protein n=1 Tax=Corynespora cassiicola Philippines TaxID=1448308 RepID=A0A2T2PA91_CORCC|nr:hypothetical protein BS50DRAFT_19184 [Corynespora cassiicola Philippines]
MAGMAGCTALHRAAPRRAIFGPMCCLPRCARCLLACWPLAASGPPLAGPVTRRDRKKEARPPASCCSLLAARCSLLSVSSTVCADPTRAGRVRRWRLCCPRAPFAHHLPAYHSPLSRTRLLRERASERAGQRTSALGKMAPRSPARRRLHPPLCKIIVILLLQPR